MSGPVNWPIACIQSTPAAQQSGIISGAFLFRYIGVLVLVCIAVLSTATAQIQPADFLAAPPAPDNSVYKALTSSETRTVISMNGNWKFSDDEGDSWSDVAIPSCYAGVGDVVFSRNFQIPAGMVGKYRWKLICNGIQYQSTILVNDQFVAQHESGLPFSIVIPEEVALKATNTIRVEVGNELGYTSTVPGRKLLLGSKTYGGIFRDMILVGVPKVWVDDIRCNTVVSGNRAEVQWNARIISGTIKGMATTTADSLGGARTISTDEGNFELLAIIRSASGVDTIPANEVGRSSTTFPLASKRTANLRLSVPIANPMLWSPESPYLYDAVIQVRYQGALVDEQTVKFGFRTLDTRGTHLLLNGQPLSVRGVAYIEDTEKYGASVPYDVMRQDIHAIKDLGANVIRFATGVPHPYLLQLCDELGLLAFVDIPIGTPPAALYTDESYWNRSLERLRFACEEGGRHSSVVAYGLSALVPGDNEDALEFVRMMRNELDSLDSRAFYFASTSWNNKELLTLADICGLVGIDVEQGTLRRTIQRAQQDIGGIKPLMMIAYGKFVQLGNHGGYSDPISIEAQAKFISDSYNVLQETGVAGGIYWAFVDYRTDRPLLTVDNGEQYLATSGLFGIDRELRQGASMLAALYTEQRTPDIKIGEYSPPSTVLFIAIGIACAIVFLVLINSSRRFRENVFRALLRPYNFYADIRDQRILSNVQSSVLGIVIAVTFAVISSSLCYYYRMDEGFDIILSAIITVDGIKEALNYLIWRPWLGIIGFTMFFFVLMLGVAFAIRLCSAFVRNKIFFRDAYIISIWGALPVLLLIPIAMVLYRLLEYPGAGVIAFTVMVGVLLWMLYRVLRGTAVIYDVAPLKVYGYALGVMAAAALIILVTSGETHATFSYLRDGIGGLYVGGS